MAHERPPWFKFDPSAFLSDAQVDAMTTLELGACLRLLCRQWIDGDLPGDLHTLGRLCRLDGSCMGDAWVTLCHFFPEVENGRRANRFMWIEREQIMAAMDKKSSDGSKAARNRWDKLRNSSDATPNGSPMPHPMQEEDKEQEKEEEQEQEQENTPLPPKGESAEQAPLVLLGEPKRKSRQSKKGPKLTDLKPDSVTAFEATWETTPPTAMQRVQTFPGKWMDQEVPVQRGSRAQAERNFQSIVDAGHATPRELYAAFYLYTQGPRNGFYQHLSTFYGPEKATWREYLTQAREAIAEQDTEKG